MNSEQLKLKGRFRKVFAGGEQKDWAFALVSFVSQESKNYTIYMTKTKVELDNFYEITITKQLNKANYFLNDLKITKPENNSDIKSMILSNVSGMGMVSIEKIEKELGHNNWSEIISDPIKVKNILKPTVYDNFYIFCKIYSDKNLSFFTDNNLTFFHNELIKVYPDIDIIEYFKINDPYDLYINGNFKLNDVDNFAIKLNPNFPIVKRLRAFVYYTFRKLEQNNNTYFEINDFISEFKKNFVENLIDIDKQILETLTFMIEQNELFFEKEFNENHFVSLVSLRKKEFDISLSIKEIINNKKSKKINLEKINLKNFSAGQVEAFNNAINNNVSIISGYPGTGKSYIIKKILSELINQKIYKEKDIALLTPTGRAATILSEKTEQEVKTIHNFLKISDVENVWESFQESSDVKVIIVDEFSMVNLHIFDLLLKVCKKVEKLILVGDENQLPCIGPGNILDDLISSKIIPVSRLTDIFRTDRVDLFEHFKSINNNKLPLLNSQSVTFYEKSNTEFLEEITLIYEEKVEKYGSINDVIVLLPSYKGMNGIDSVNRKIQEWNIKRNNLTKSISLKIKGVDSYYYVGDKVIQIVNDYDRNVFNGEIGYIDSINEKTNEIFVNYDDKKIIKYKKSELIENIKLAYAITIHKFQGSEAKCVIFGVVKDLAEHMLTKKLLYTAVSRAKEELILIGSSILYSQKIKNNSNITINTYLKKFIAGDKKWN
ncbi:exodeoxyribonuclease V C-terminal fragment [Mycoplasmopsis maculosa]|uniref:Exodeoxyribonuclease V C-terminal n=1 Tax=Mycoplasmopsis maculosa TaxID=114885 RepID=A0A449B4X1_9BACT|nr:AAA family ATPase [Mycoplasmopsis maculosa]VEU75619.1 exodeoxyribonuclease V C-terminal fragment [Mycoplasmopsis maculosa]